ncbi:MAG: hypothetical protein QM723_31575 [Myxococcaceae bacterium]
MKTAKRSFDRFFYYALDEQGRVWRKSIAEVKETAALAPDWQLVGGTGLPQDERRKEFVPAQSLESINADQDELMVVSSAHRHYSVRWFENPVFKEDTPPGIWSDLHGWPLAGPLVWDARVDHNRGWAMGRRTRKFLLFEDALGRTFDGGGGLSTYYFLDKGGTQIDFTDSGLPFDFSHTVCGPERGAFIAESLQVGGDTLLLINAYGELRTRTVDFDTNGSDTMFFTYAYDRGDQRKEAIAVPSEDWFEHKPVPLSGRAQISTETAIAVTGMHNRDRELRVGGYDRDRVPGYWAKKIFEQKDGSAERLDPGGWTFHPAPDAEPKPEHLLDPNDTDPDYERVVSRQPVPIPDWLERHKPPRRAPVQALAYEGELVSQSKALPVKVAVSDFNLECTPAKVRLEAGGEAVELTLHTVENWYHLRRLDPGHDGTPKEFQATLELPADAKVTQPGLKAALAALAPYQLKAFAFFAQGSENYLRVESKKGQGDPLSFELTRRGAGFASVAVARRETLERGRFYQRARSPEVQVGKPLGELTKADLPLLKNRLAVNAKLKPELERAASELDTQDEKTPAWLSAAVMGVLHAASGPDLIKVILPAMPFRNVSNEEASYYAQVLTTQLPPLLERSQKLKGLLDVYQRRDLLRAESVISARRSAYQKRIEQLENGDTSPAPRFHEDLPGWWADYRFHRAPATLVAPQHGSPSRCQWTVDDEPIFWDPSKPGAGKLHLEASCAGGAKSRLVIALPTAERDFYEAAQPHPNVFASGGHPTKLLAWVQLESSPDLPAAHELEVGLFPSGQAAAQQELEGELVHDGGVFTLTTAGLTLQWKR